jgi:hypothetical protein
MGFNNGDSKCEFVACDRIDWTGDVLFEEKEAGFAFIEWL